MVLFVSSLCRGRSSVFSLGVLILCTFLTRFCAPSGDYNPLHYDRTTPTYSPSGTLLQLSYTLPPSASVSVVVTRPLFHVVARKSASSSPPPSPSGPIQKAIFKITPNTLLLAAAGYSPDILPLFTLCTSELDPTSLDLGMSAVTQIKNHNLKRAYGNGIRVCGCLSIVVGGEACHAVTPGGAVKRLPREYIYDANGGGRWECEEEDVKKVVERCVERVIARPGRRVEEGDGRGVECWVVMRKGVVEVDAEKVVTRLVASRNKTTP